MVPLACEFWGKGFSHLLESSVQTFTHLSLNPPSLNEGTKGQIEGPDELEDLEVFLGHRRMSTKHDETISTIPIATKKLKRTNCVAASEQIREETNLFKHL